MELKQIIEENYQAVVARGSIYPETRLTDFFEKADEEKKEMVDAYYESGEYSQEFERELIDCICVYMNLARHLDIDIEQGLIDNYKRNYERAKTTTNETK